MDKFWEAALKVTGPVAVIGFILWSVVQKIFEEDMLALFGTEQRFIITILVVAGLIIGLITATFLLVSKPKEKIPVSNEEKKSVKIKESTIEGDFVMGDKIENRGDK